MDADKILKSDILDIIFDGRDKEYGAYDMRRTYNRRITIALISTIVLVLVIFAIKALASSMNKEIAPQELVVNESKLQQMKPEEPPPPPPPPPKLPPPPEVATVQYTTPKIVEDKEVVKPPPEVKQIEEAKIDLQTKEGTKDIGIIAPPSEEKGTGIVAAPVKKQEDPDHVFTKVEVEAKFPGGQQAWSKYVRQAIMRELDEFTERDYGTVMVKFIVSKDGSVSEVSATTMQGTKLAEVAVNAIRKGPKWIPAQQNGRYVNAYRVQPVTLQNPNQ